MILGREIDWWIFNDLKIQDFQIPDEGCHVLKNFVSKNKGMYTKISKLTFFVISVYIFPYIPLLEKIWMCGYIKTYIKLLTWIHIQYRVARIQVSPSFLLTYKCKIVLNSKLIFLTANLKCNGNIYKNYIQELITSLTKRLPFIIQYLFLNVINVWLQPAWSCCLW